MSSLTVRRIKMSLYGESYQSDKNEVRGCTVDYILKKNIVRKVYCTVPYTRTSIHTYINPLGELSLQLTAWPRRIIYPIRFVQFGILIIATLTTRSCTYCMIN